MNKKRDRKSPSPHSVAAIASFMVLVVGAGVGAYFVEFRGVGVQQMLSSAQSQELLMLLGGVAVCTLLTQFMVAGAARPSGAQDNVRDMVRAVLELDPEDPEAVRRFGSVPELHELAMMIATEKNDRIDAIQQLQAQRRDLAGLLKGMERSSVTGEPLREEQNTETCSQIARAWNSLIANRGTDHSAASTNHSALPTMQGPGSPEPGMIQLGDALDQTSSLDHEVSERFDRVEQSLEHLQRMLRDMSTTPVADDARAAAHAPYASPVTPSDDTREAGLGADVGAPIEEEHTATPSAYHEWNPTAADALAASREPTTRDTVEPLLGLENTRPSFAPPVELPGMGGDLPMADATFGTSMPDAPVDLGSISAPHGPQASTASESSVPELENPGALETFGSAAGATSQSPVGAPPDTLGLSDAGDAPNAQPMPSFGVSPTEPAVGPGAPPSQVRFGASSPELEKPGGGESAPSRQPAQRLEGEVDKEFAQHFPHFVGQPVDQVDGQIEVTYGHDTHAPQLPSPSTPQNVPGAPRLPQDHAPQSAPELPQTPPAPPTQANAPTPPPPARKPRHVAAGTAAPATPKNPRQFPESQVIDLRSLGAVEFED